MDESRFNDRANEVFFGAAVVLVEGDVDEIACRTALEALGTDLERRSISILSVGGLSEIVIFAELLTGLGIPAVALVDEDPGNAVSAGRRAAIAQHLPAAQLLLQVPRLEGLWGLQQKPSGVHAMANFPATCANLANIPRVYRDLQTLLGNLAP